MLSQLHGGFRFSVLQSSSYLIAFFNRIKPWIRFVASASLALSASIWLGHLAKFNLRSFDSLFAADKSASTVFASRLASASRERMSFPASAGSEFVILSKISFSAMLSSLVVKCYCFPNLILQSCFHFCFCDMIFCHYTPLLYYRPIPVCITVEGCVVRGQIQMKGIGACCEARPKFICMPIRRRHLRCYRLGWLLSPFSPQ